jgi:hypothetical protein
LFWISYITIEPSIVWHISRFGIKYRAMHSVLGRNILFGCQSYGIKVIDYFNIRHFSFRGSSFQRLYAYMNHNNIGVDFL